MLVISRHWTEREFRGEQRRRAGPGSGPIDQLVLGAVPDAGHDGGEATDTEIGEIAERVANAPVYGKR